METGEVLHHAFVWWDGTVELCKGDQTVSAAETAQANFTNTLQQIFSTQYATQQAQLQFLQNTLQPQIANPQGYTPAQLTAMRTGATDTIAQQTANAQQAVQATEAARGGNGLPSGVSAQIDAQLKEGQAQQTSAAQNTITTQNAQLQQQNYWNAISALSGTAAQENPLGYSGAATSGANSVGNLGQVEYNTQQSGVLGALTGLAGSVAGAAGRAGGFGALFGGGSGPAPTP